MKRSITILTIISLFLPVLALAQGNINQTNQNESASGEDVLEETQDEITAQDLEVNEPKVLPNSPWYWAKSFWRSLKLWATLDPVNKAEKRLEIANERLIELKALIEAGDISEDQAEKILEKYDKEIEKLKTHLDKIKDKTQDDADELLSKLTKQEFIRQRLMTKLQEKLKPELMERFQEKSLEKFGQIINDLDEEKIKEKIEEVLSDDPLKIKNLNNLQVLEGLKDKVPEKAKSAIIKAQTNALKRLGESFREMDYEEKVEKVKELLDGLNDDESLEDILERVGDEVEGSLPLLTNIINQAKSRIQERNQGGNGVRRNTQEKADDETNINEAEDDEEDDS